MIHHLNPFKVYQNGEPNLCQRIRLTKKPLFTIHVGRGASKLIVRWFGFLKIVKHR